jgi:hypothetical protein
MIKVFEITLSMYLKTISPDVPRFTFVCSIYTSIVYLFLKKMENLRRFFSISEVRGGKLFLNVVWLKYDHFSIANKKNCLVNSKVKEFFMCFYVIFMNKHVGITLSVFLLVLYTAGADPGFVVRRGKLRLKVKFFWSDKNGVVGSELSFK